MLFPDDIEKGEKPEQWYVKTINSTYFPGAQGQPADKGPGKVI